MTKPTRHVTKQPANARGLYRCAECGWESLRWVGRCGQCLAWGTVEQAGAPALRAVRAAAVSVPARPIGEVDVEAARARPTGVGELDRVLGGGLVSGAVLLLAGEPGIGKSTLLLDVAARCAGGGLRTLYVTGEESAGQVRLRAERIHALHPELYLAAETDLSVLLGHVEQVEPRLVVVDSVQTVASPEVDGAPGGVNQVREVAGALIRVAKERGIVVVIVGHVTKDGAIAGPRTLEHLVDVVLQVEGERHARLRLVRAVKNRYGPTDEVGCFELGEAGLTELADPSGLFLSGEREPVPGTCVTITLEGRRPLVAELQALTVPTNAQYPRRTTSGIESSRLAMVLAVLEKRAGREMRLSGSDVYAATVGGVKVSEPAADLALALALASSALDAPLPGRLVAVGEVGLAGEIRRVTGIGRRLTEAARLGFTQAVVPAGTGPTPRGMRLVESGDLAAALRALLSGSGRR